MIAHSGGRDRRRRGGASTRVDMSEVHVVQDVTTPPLGGGMRDAETRFRLAGWSRGARRAPSSPTVPEVAGWGAA